MGWGGGKSNQTNKIENPNSNSKTTKQTNKQKQQNKQTATKQNNKTRMFAAHVLVETSVAIDTESNETARPQK